MHCLQRQSCEVLLRFDIKIITDGPLHYNNFCIGIYTDEMAGLINIRKAILAPKTLFKRYSTT